MSTRHVLTILLAALLMGAGMTYAAEDQAALIKVLQSDAPKPEKAITCKKLVLCGTKDAVPALAALLPDKELSSWARIALENIPDPACDDALRDGLNKVQGRQLIGVINSIAYRRDAKAVEPLIQKLKDADADIASAAAVALGKIGGDQAAAALEPCTSAGPIRSAAAEGSIYCAERFLAAGNREQAIKIYDSLRAKADLPKQRLVEATRGAIVAREAAGVPILVEQLRAQDKMLFGAALRIARELRAGPVSDALIAELGKAAPDRQPLFLLALADRGDAEALPAALQLLKNGAPNVRIVAATVIERLGNASCVPALVEATASDDAELAQAATTALARLPGKEVDQTLFARLEQSSGKARQALIGLVEQRKIEGALPLFLKFAEDPDKGVRTAALESIGAIGEDKQVPDLVRLLAKASNPDDRAAIEKALMAISGRWTSACVPHLLPLAKSGDSATRVTAIHALLGCGGAEALATINAALEDKDEAVQDEAVRSLSTWANRWPEDASVTAPLLNLAKNAKKPQHKVLALRGYLQFVQGAKRMADDQRLAKIEAIVPLVDRPEEKRSVVAALGAIGNAKALQQLLAYASDPKVAEEACAAIVSITSKGNRGVPKPQRKAALQVVLEKSKNEGIKAKAKETLDGIR